MSNTFGKHIRKSNSLDEIKRIKQLELEKRINTHNAKYKHIYYGIILFILVFTPAFMLIFTAINGSGGDGNFRNYNDCYAHATNSLSYKDAAYFCGSYDWPK